MNGAIMGMTKVEITRKLDEIIDFAGVERYIDTPVKRYSSGMTVRLGFAIAAHLEPEILVVDEVLAVGDAEFQKKAIGKMQDVSKGEGRTVLFVSHNMASVKMLCNRGIILNNGFISNVGDIKTIIQKYEENLFKKNESLDFIDLLSYCKKNILNVTKVLINNNTSNPILLNIENREINVKIEGYLNLDSNLSFEAKLFDTNENPLLFYSSSHFSEKKGLIKMGKYFINETITLPDNINSGNYRMTLYLTDPGKEFLAVFEYAVDLYIEGMITKVGNALAYEQGYGFLTIK